MFLLLNLLYIENVAVIEKAEMEFKKGFNVLTGETGAGKSIIISSINALLGGKISKDMIRSGADYAFVSGSFSVDSDEVLDILSKYGYNTDDENGLILQRKLSISGKSTCRINGRPTTLTILKEVASYLVNIHGQHESYNLMSADKHINYIDNMGSFEELKREYRKNLAILRECKRKLNNAKDDDSHRERQIDLLKYQINEIEEANPQIGEYEKLIEERKRIENAQDIIQSLSKVDSAFSGENEYRGCLSVIQDCGNALDEISEYFAQAQKLSQRITNAFYELQDCAQEVSSLIESVDTDPYRLEEIEERLDVLYRLSKKYGSTTEEILEFCDNAKRELEQLEDYKFNIENINKSYNESFETTKKLALQLSKKRKEISQEFMLKVKNEMVYLDMPNVTLKVNIERCPLNENGCDKLEFLISANLGEEPKPVSKIASGGELSRMMLAITNVLAQDNMVETMIFDEVDTGISGSASQKVGYKLKLLSEKRQVICITHQAQIACLADEHFLIKKYTDNNRTYTKVELMDFEQRKYELARIIGGISITELTLKHAEEMLLNK